LALTFLAFYPYIRGILNGQTRPHIFTWCIWGVGTLVVFVAQLMDGGGYGAIVIGVSGLMTLGIAGLALRHNADLSIVPLDWVFLLLAASALPFWVLTETALAAVIILTVVDLLGFGPSVRKAYFEPWSENATFFAIGVVRNLMVILALGQYSWTTVLFPAAVAIACAAFVTLILIRRRFQPPTDPSGSLPDAAS